MKKSIYSLPFLCCLLLTACSVTRQAPLGPLPSYASPTSEELRIRAPTELAYRVSEQISEENLWQLIAQELTFAPHHYAEKRVLAEERKLKAHPEYLGAVNERARLFLFYVYHELRKRDMPPELAFVPALESGYDPYAYSPVGASGLWQFTASTGLSFGLNTTWWYSDRRDVVFSTKAALNYLSYLYDRYEDWFLALAAYNAGERRVNRAIRRNARSGKPTDFWHLDLPRETERYVPRLIAFAKVFTQEFDAPIANRPFWARVYNQEQISFRELLAATGLESETFFMLNAEQNQFISSPHKDHFLVPSSQQEVARKALAELHSRAYTKWIGYRLAVNEDLQEVGNKFNIAETTLQRINDVAKLRQGSYLLIPLTSQQYVDLTPDTDGVYVLPPRYVAKAQGVAQKVYHRVGSGESLWKISREYGVSIHSIKNWNNIRDVRFIYPGQKILIAAPSQSYEPSIKLAAAYNREVVREIYYRIRRGDSLYAIANKFRIDIDELRKWNQNRGKSRYIYPGRHIRLYVDVTNL